MHILIMIPMPNLFPKMDVLVEHDVVIVVINFVISFEPVRKIHSVFYSP